MHELSARNNLLDEIEFVSIDGEDRQAGLRGCQVDQRIIEAFLALLLKILGARQHAGDDTGIDPELMIRYRLPAVGKGVEESDIVIADGPPSGTRRVEIGDAGGEFGQAHRAVEQQRALDQFYRGSRYPHA